MNKYVVITTINEPTPAILKIKNMAKDWQIIIVGDLRTPHDKYSNMDGVCYLSPEYQAKEYPEYSAALGWNTSCRRNIGFIEAYRRGAGVLALIDDDNIPLDGWASSLVVGKTISVRCYESTQCDVFDPISVTNCYTLWHRGFPIDKVRLRDVRDCGFKEVKVLVQANLWNGNPDVDAIERLVFDHEISFDVTEYYTSSASYMPFNSQNTFIDRSVIPYYMLLPGIGRVDDVWGAYLVQKELNNKMPFIVYGPPTVYQKRNDHNLLDDFDKECFASVNCSRFLAGDDILPEKTKTCYEIYRQQFKK